LETFVNALSKWANYWTKTENIDQTGYNITADYFFGDGSQLTGITGETYNETYHNTYEAWEGNYSAYSQFWYNMTTESVEVNYRWDTDGTNIYNTTASVGIGLASPEKELHVNGTIAITNKTAGGTGYIYNNGTAMIFE
jgi:hypothetical protein